MLLIQVHFPDMHQSQNAETLMSMAKKGSIHKAVKQGEWRTSLKPASKGLSYLWDKGPEWS